MTTEIRDNRNPGWLWADRNIVKRDGKALGPYGLAVYMALCAHANTDQQAWPSVTTIAEMVGCSERKAREMIRLLEELGWIVVEHRTDPKGDPTSNIYTLLDDPQGGGAHHAPGVGHTMPHGGAHHAGKRKPTKESHTERGNGKKPPSADFLTVAAMSEEYSVKLDEPVSYLSEVVSEVLGVPVPDIEREFDQNWRQYLDSLFGQTPVRGVDAIDMVEEAIRAVVADPTNDGWVRNAASPRGLYKAVSKYMNEGGTHEAIVVT